MGKERKKRAAQKAKAAKAAAATQTEAGLIARLVSLMLENWKKLIIPLGHLKKTRGYIRTGKYFRGAA